MIRVRVFWTHAACRWGSSWPGSAACLRRRCRDTGVCKAGWACPAHPTSTPHTLRCCHWSRHQPPAGGNTIKESKPTVENVFLHWCSETQRGRQEASLILSPLIPGCCICSQCRRSPAVGNSHRPPVGSKQEVQRDGTQGCHFKITRCRIFWVWGTMVAVGERRRRRRRKLQRSPLVSALEASHSSCRPRADNREISTCYLFLFSSYLSYSLCEMLRVSIWMMRVQFPVSIFSYYCLSIQSNRNK